MKKQIEIFIMHCIAGRIRLKLSKPVTDEKKFAADIRHHPGISRVRYTGLTRTVLIEYDTAEVTQAEILTRVSLFLSIENNLSPVLLSFSQDEEHISITGYLAGLLLVAGAAANFVPYLQTYKKTLETTAAIATMAAVVKHGLEEIRSQGQVDPEVISVFYLLHAMLKGNSFHASAITWGTSFGRHLVQTGPGSVVIHPQKTGNGNTYEVDVQKQNNQNLASFLFKAVPSLLFDFLAGGMIGKETLIQQMKTMSDSHEDTIEGLANLEEGFRIIVH